MKLLLAALGTFAGGGIVAYLLAAARRERLAILVATGAALVGAALGLAAAVPALGGGAVAELRAPWRIPGGEIHLAIDRLSAFFLAIVMAISGLAALFGAGYLDHYRGKRPLGAVLLWYNLLVPAMALIVTARDAILFLFAWELMTLTAYLLVSFEGERAEVRRAALVYIVTTHLAASFLLAFWLILGRRAGSFDFDAIAAAGPPAGALGAALFAFALLGFGTKAGLAPLHIWLPEAHPAAPSHVSAVMSAVILKTALYALLRGLSFLGTPAAWWGYALLGAGALSAVGGVLYALVQHDLKRLLAYSSIENVGIATLGFGAGLLGVAKGNDSVALLGFAGGLLHIMNHAAMKGLLFLGAGSVAAATHSRAIDRQGGLLRRMPATGATFLAGAAAISGLPPLAGFASEWLIYAALFTGALELHGWARVTLVALVPALALTGGLAAATFAKAFGLVFLGEPRAPGARDAHEGGLAMRAPLVALAAACLAIGLFPQVAARLVLPLAASLARIDAARAADLSARVLDLLGKVSGAAGLLLAVAAGLAIARRALLGAQQVAAGPTWGCGYAAPAPRMQYSGASFAGPLQRVFGALLRPAVEASDPRGYFPRPGERATETADLAEHGLFRPLVRRAEARLLALHRLQQGRIQLYLLYVLLTLVALLLWQFFVWGGPPQ